MSWKGWVDGMIENSRNSISQAAIIGNNGTIYAKTDDFLLTQEEISNILTKPVTETTQGHLTLASKSYLTVCNRSDEYLGIKAAGGVHIMRTYKVIVVCVIPDGANFVTAQGVLNNVIQALTDGGF